MESDASIRGCSGGIESVCVFRVGNRSYWGWKISHPEKLWYLQAEYYIEKVRRGCGTDDMVVGLCGWVFQKRERYKKSGQNSNVRGVVWENFMKRRQRISNICTLHVHLLESFKELIKIIGLWGWFKGGVIFWIIIKH